MAISSRTAFKYALFMVIALDAVGFGIVTPVLAPMIRQISSVISEPGSGLMARQMTYGLIIAIYPLSYIIGSPILGGLSDRWGRKPLLIVSLLGSLLGFAGYALSLHLQSLSILVIARVLTGVTAGSQGVAQAAMVDVSKSSRDKAVNIGLIAVAMTLGLVLGPLIGGVLADSNWLPWFQLTTPFYCVIVLCLISLALLVWGLADSSPASDSYDDQSAQVGVWQALRILFKTPAVISLLIVFLLFELGWSLYYQTLPLVWVHQFDATQFQVGLVLAYVGIMLCVGLVILVQWATRRWTIVACIKASLFWGAAGLIILKLWASLWAQFLLAIPITWAVALGYTGIITLVSNQLEHKRQGLLMGVTDALLSAAFAATVLLASWVTMWGLYLPFIIAALFWLLGWVLLRVTHQAHYLK